MSALEERLDQLVADLRTGRIEGLEEATAAIAAALEALERPDAATLARIRARAAEAGILLEAAGRGVRAARWRLSEIRAMGADGGRLVTYDGRGRRAPPASRPQRRRRRDRPSPARVMPSTASVPGSGASVIVSLTIMSSWSLSLAPPPSSRSR